MTDYDKMTDEELSAAVAESVMEWKLLPWKTCWLLPEDQHEYTVLVEKWRPATDWSDAGRVLEKMRADGWEIVLNFGGMSKDPERQCFATFMRESDDGGPWHDHQGIGESLPRAICIAALRAVEARA